MEAMKSNLCLEDYKWLSYIISGLKDIKVYPYDINSSRLNINILVTELALSLAF